MPKTIQQTVALAAPPDQLFDMYVDAELHAAMTGSPVMIGPEPGAEFRAFNGLIWGRMLYVLPKRVIVQTWRSVNFGPDDIDSILLLSFSSELSGGRIDLVQVNVADRDYDGVSQGWERYYWTPWRAYLDEKQR